jgi:hypothetical protein
MVLHSETVTDGSRPPIRHLSLPVRKAVGPLSARTRLHADFLLVCELDPRVTAISEGDETIVVGEADLHAPDYRIEGDDGSVLVDVLASTYDRTIERFRTIEQAAHQQALAYRLETTATIRHDVRFQAARLIYDCRRRSVPAGDRVRILYALDDNGALPLVEVSGLAHASIDGVAAVLALACESLVEIEIHRGIVPEALVRRRKPILSE